MSEPQRFTRRTFAAVLTAGATAPAILAQRGTAPEVPPFQSAIEFSRKDVPPKEKGSPMGQGKLLPSLYTTAAEWNRGYMRRLSADRLLYNFRENAGLPVGSAQPFGGWEAKADGKRPTELRGHFTGHFL